MRNKGFKTMVAILVAGMMMTTSYTSYVTAEENTAVETQAQDDAEEKAKAEAEAKANTAQAQQTAPIQR